MHLTLDVDLFVEEGDVRKLQEVLESLDPVPERVGVVQLEVGVDLESEVRLQGPTQGIKDLEDKAIFELSLPISKKTYLLLPIDTGCMQYGASLSRISSCVLLFFTIR